MRLPFVSRATLNVLLGALARENESLREQNAALVRLLDSAIARVGLPHVPGSVPAPPPGDLDPVRLIPLPMPAVIQEAIDVTTPALSDPARRFTIAYAEQHRARWATDAAEVAAEILAGAG